MNAKLKFFHVKDFIGWKGNPVGYTVGYARVDDKTLVCSFARAGDKDKHTKARGRQIAKGRFDKGIVTQVDCPKGGPVYEALKQAILEHELNVQANYGR